MKLSKTRPPRQSFNTKTNIYKITRNRSQTMVHCHNMKNISVNHIGNSQQYS